MKPNYFSILPANVRYADIPDRAKLLFSEITALSNKEGYCWASNQYFADLYKCSMQAISKQINILKAAGFIRVFIDPTAGNARRISPVMDVNYQPGVESYQPVVDRAINQELRPYQPVVEYNNTGNNTRDNNRGEYAQSAAPAVSSPVNDKPKKTRTITPRPGIDILTDADFRKEMAEKFPALNVAAKLDYMIDQIAAKGYKYQDYKAAARNWLRKDLEALKASGKLTAAPQAGKKARSLAELED
jgi:biotin operon repressor